MKKFNPKVLLKLFIALLIFQLFIYIVADYGLFKGTMIYVICESIYEWYGEINYYRFWWL